MGRIKSALEIALEKTEGVKGDKGSIGLFEAKQQGKRLANDFLSGEKSLEEEIKKIPKEKLESVRQGVFEVLVSQVSLPAVPEDIKRLERTGGGLVLIIGDRRFAPLFQRFIQAVSQYLDEAAQYEEALKRQYAPKLRQKEEELARRIGRAIKLDPFQDPEFVAFFNQNINALKANYEGLAAQVREQAGLLFGERQGGAD
ncbi:MAG: hypothetical protein LBI67_03985 [Treponema sp.]|jgi:hypothetical protein|nr:hypothetical protein [Treponema sp.]